MPKSGEVDQSYPNKLKQIGLELLEPFKGATRHHMLKCLVCEHVWKATPSSKIQGNKKRGGNGCPQCNTGTALSHNDFLQRLEQRNQRLPNKVYLKAGVYLNSKTAVAFQCDKGHSWFAPPNNIVYNATGCPICKREEESVKKRKSTNTWISNFKSVHGNRYDYHLFSQSYDGTNKPATIVCRIHGEFKQRPSGHFRDRQGCPQCAIQSMRKPDRFLNESKIIHNNKYDYSKVQYKNTITRVEIICPIHGSFLQRPNDHLKGHGCIQCKNISFSTKALIWLQHIMETENIFIQHAGNQGEYRIPGTNMFVDGFCRETNTVYEFDGDAFHGNLERYPLDYKCHPFNKTVTTQYLHQQTLKKHHRLRQQYNLVTIWESDFEKLQLPPKTFDCVVNRMLHTDYPSKLLLIGIQLLEEYKGAKEKHKMLCTECGYVWFATPLSKIQTNKKRNTRGCPKCNNKRSKFKKYHSYARQKNN